MIALGGELRRIIDARREIEALAAEVADAAGAHPAWLTFTSVAAVLERVARARADERVARARGDADGIDGAYAMFLAANGGPRTDAWMGRARGRGRADAGDLRDRAVTAVLRARAAASVLPRLDGRFPAQPLLVALRRERGWLTRIPAPAAPFRVVFILPSGALLCCALREAPSDVEAAAAEDKALAEGLGAALAGRPLPAGSPLEIARAAGDVGSVAVAVSLVDEPLATARHAHRRAWTLEGGPWLGLVDAGDREIVTTCHFAIDGYAHAQITSGILAAIDAAKADRAAVAALEAASAAGLGSSPRGSSIELGPPPGAEPLACADALLEGASPSITRAAYAFGVALARVYQASPPRGPAREHGVTFQIPIAPGAASDPDRRRRRVLFALSSLRFERGAPEPYGAYRARLQAQLAREATGSGLLSRVAAATTAAPLPRSLLRRVLASPSAPSPTIPPIEALAGRGCLSSMRFDPGETPSSTLYAASSPGLPASPRDPRGSAVLTIIDHGGAASATLCTNGAAAPGDVLAAWREALDHLSR